MSASSTVTERTRRPYPRHQPLSQQTQSWLLGMLRDRAEQGDLEAADRLFRIARDMPPPAPIRAE